jgi:hypothetical protein
MISYCTKFPYKTWWLQEEQLEFNSLRRKCYFSCHHHIQNSSWARSTSYKGVIGNDFSGDRGNSFTSDLFYFIFPFQPPFQSSTWSFSKMFLHQMSFCISCFPHQAKCPSCHKFLELANLTLLGMMHKQRSFSLCVTLNFQQSLSLASKYFSQHMHN